MTKKLVIFLIISFLLAGCDIKNYSGANQNQFMSDDEFSNWVTYYYLSPQPQRLSSGLKYFCNSKLYNNELMLPMMSFFVAALKDKDAILEKTYVEMNKSGTNTQRIFFLDVLWLINTNKSRNLIDKAANEWTAEAVQNKIKQQKQSRPYDALIIPIVSPQVLDMLWATFFATGNEEAIQRIIYALPLADEKQASKLLIGNAAKWSLESNAKQHKKVLMICKKELKKQKGSTRNLLEEILDKVNQ
jgi:hypothetical protein